jgi:hypothetical protein
MLGHHSQRLVGILQSTEGDALLGRHVANLHLIGVSPLCWDPRRDNTVGQQPDQPVVLDSRERTTSSSCIIFAVYATDFSATMVLGLEFMTSRLF